jgi:hypothetical protein
MIKYRHLFILIGCILIFSGYKPVFAQTASLSGQVTRENKQAVQWVNIILKGTKTGATTDANGRYRLQLPARKPIHLSISYIGYRQIDTLLVLKEGEQKTINFRLEAISTNLPGFEVHDERLRTESIVRLNPRDVAISPSSASGVEGLIKTLPGVSSNNELSAEYSVRGGNFDENLVYVNGIEIYRPFLVNSGQQEGLSFINPDLVSSIQFSAGGFGAEYGDKMSSVLDIQYMQPRDFGGSLTLSMMGANFSIHGISKNKRFTYLVGARYKTNRYLLNSLETTGEYQPRFTDLQSLFTYRINKRLKLSWLTYFSSNQYRVIPSDRQTDFGTVQQSLRFTVFFDGQENDNYQLGQSALTLAYLPNKSTKLQFILSDFQTNETETYDVQGQYWIGQVENRQSSQNQGEAVQTLGVGTYLKHARNYFYANVLSFEHKGSYSHNNQYIRWGFRYQYQQVDDRLREWELNDSAGYSLPNPPDHPGSDHPERQNFNLYYFAQGNNLLNTHRFSAWASDHLNLQLADKGKITLGGGARLYYWTPAQELLFSPRFNFSFKPFAHPNLVLRFAAGVYYQPPFYREMRKMDGSLNTAVRAQRSIQFILGSDYRFQMSDRPFIFTSELYYKKLDRLIPYEVQDVRIRYYAGQTAKGYATGLDLKLYGEFVKGIDSWITLSLLKTAEDVANDQYYQYYNATGERLTSPSSETVDSVLIEPGFIPRPSDRRVNFTIYFQDYIPRHEQFKVHLRLLYGTGLPFGPPQSERYKQNLRMPDYRRVDIGFSWNPLSRQVKKISAQKIESMWLSLEVFNLFQIYNTVSYNWIKDVYNHQFAIPNYLTSRRINLKLVMKF